MSYADTQAQRSLERLVASHERMQKDLRSIAETMNQLSKMLETFKSNAEQAGMLDRIEQVKRLHDNGLGGSQISELLDLDYWIVMAVIHRYEEDKDDE